MLENIVVATPLKPGYSETFLNAHLRLLPANIFHIHSKEKMGYYPIYGPNYKPLFSDNKLFNYIETGLERSLGIGHFFRERAILEIIRINEIKCVLAEYGPLGGELTKVCKKANVPLIVHFHGRDAYHYETLKKYKKKYREMFNYASAVIGVSTDMVQQLEKVGAKKETLHLNPYGPNQELFFPSHKVKQTPIHFLSVGRFCDKKAPDLLIKSFKFLCQKYPNSRLTMVADGPLWDSAKKLAAELGLSENVIFAGRKSPKEIAELHKQSRAFVQHSVRAEDGDSEGTPVAILEAMASGLPIISTRHAGIKDVVIEGETGLLVDEKDIEGMGQNMIKLADNPSLAEEMGQKGAHRIKNNYTMKRHINKLWQILQSTFTD